MVILKEYDSMEARKAEAQEKGGGKCEFDNSLEGMHLEISRFWRSILGHGHLFQSISALFVIFIDVRTDKIPHKGVTITSLDKDMCIRIL